MTAEGAETAENLNWITERVIGAAMRVHQALGPGLLESAYEACLAFELADGGMQVVQQQPLPVVYRNVRLSCGYRLDFIVEVKARAAQKPLFDAVRRAGAHDRVLAAAERERDRDLFAGYEGPISESGDRMRTMYKLHRLRLIALWRPRHGSVQLPLEYDGRRVVTERLVRELKGKGLVVQVWTVNEPADMRQLLDWGVDGVLSDRPDLLAEVMGR